MTVDSTFSMSSSVSGNPSTSSEGYSDDPGSEDAPSGVRVDDTVPEDVLLGAINQHINDLGTQIMQTSSVPSSLPPLRDSDQSFQFIKPLLKYYFTIAIALNFTLVYDFCLASPADDTMLNISARHAFLMFIDLLGRSDTYKHVGAY